ncbi:MAG: VOC family protein [Anaerolineaceae bacterium]|nr:VOC family protein [Anaerolineaceae bacterium]
MLKASWHFSFTVSDIERSIAFYRDLLGMRLVHRQEQANEYTARLVGYENAHLKVAQLTIDDMPDSRSGHLLELVEYVHPHCEATDTAICRPGTSHMAFEVSDIHTDYERLLAAGVHFNSPPNAITSGINRGGYTCYFRDPDDITLEMVEMPAR